MPEYEFYFNFFGIKLEGTAAMLGMLTLHFLLILGALTLLSTIFDLARRLWRKNPRDTLHRG